MLSEQGGLWVHRFEVVGGEHHLPARSQRGGERLDLPTAGVDALGHEGVAVQQGHSVRIEHPAQIGQETCQAPVGLRVGGQGAH